MKVVLVHPPLHNVVPAATPDYVDNNRGFTPPMGLLYIQAALDHSQHHSTFIDANLNGWTHEFAAEYICKLAPDIVGIQAMTFTLPDACILAKEIKRFNANIKIVMGGPHPTIYPQETANLPYVDYVIIGEGEKTFVSFLDNFKLMRKKVIGTSDWIVNLDTVAMPARRASEYTKYSSVLAKHNPITVMITSRGCPFECIFCNRMGRKYRAHSAEYVIKEFEQVAELGIPEVFIHDDTFSIDRKRVNNICLGIRRLGMTWEARTRIDCVDEGMLVLMKAAGCDRLSFGVESGSESVLRDMCKHIKLSRVKEVFKMCRDIGITTLADFMMGNLNEKREDIAKTLDLMKAIKPDYVQFSICSPYPDTPLYKLGLINDVLPRDVWRDFASNPLDEFDSPVWTQHFTKEELVAITAAAYKTFYMQPRFIMKQLRNIKSWQQLKTMARGAMGMLLK